MLIYESDVDLWVIGKPSAELHNWDCLSCTSQVEIGQVFVVSERGIQFLEEFAMCCLTNHKSDCDDEDTHSAVFFLADL